MSVLDRRANLETMALKRQKDLERLKISLEDAGFIEAFDVLHSELGVESLHDVRLVEDEDIDGLASLPIIKRRKLKSWVRRQHPVHQPRRLDVEVFSFHKSLSRVKSVQLACKVTKRINIQSSQPNLQPNTTE